MAGSSGGDFIAQPLTGLHDAVFHRGIGFFGAGFDGIPRGFSGALGGGELLGQL